MESVEIEDTDVNDGEIEGTNPDVVEREDTDVAHMMSKMNKLSGESSAEEVVVGLTEKVEEIREHLVRGSSRRDVVSIVGMGELGKTTLAKKLYGDRYVEERFNVRAWCAISQVYRKREVLLDILRDLIGHTKNNKMRDEEDLAAEVYRSLKERRYLIIIDDIWDIEAWNGLKRSFPDDNNGSRIIITSRIQLGVETHSFSLDLFDEEKSWELLRKKIFPQENCPRELVDVGQRISKLCGGLPLAIVVIAGILARSEKQQDMWEKVAVHIRDHISEDASKFMNIIGLSYEHLPNHLKPCFLYLGAFPEDRPISASRLKRLWICEGFIRDAENKSLDCIAESYLNDLIGRSLVIASKTRSKWRAKTLRIHDLLLDFCLKKAKAEKFFDLITGNDLQRAIFYSAPHSFAANNTPAPHVSSILCFDRESLSLKSYENLKVLDTHHDLNARELLTSLRYLAADVITTEEIGSSNLWFESTKIPFSIGNLQNLQVFELKDLMTEYEMPNTFWELRSLKCVQIQGRIFFPPLEDTSESSCSQLLCLERLSTLYLCCDQSEKILRRLPNLRKLACIFDESWDFSNNFNMFPVLDFLTNLESLDMSLGRCKRYPTNQLSLPLSLKKLVLSGFLLPWSEISHIAKLPNLEVLKLGYKAFQGDQWDLQEGYFPKLRYLRLDKIRFFRWSVDGDVFPSLELLVVEKCYDFEEIPFEFANIHTLEKIEIRRCSFTVSDSARKIREEKRDYGSEKFELIIKDEFKSPEGLDDSTNQFRGHLYGDGFDIYQSEVVCSPTDATLAASIYYGSLFLWTIDKKDFGFELGDPERRWVYGLTFSTDGLLLAAGVRGYVLVWDISSRNLKCKLEGSPRAAYRFIGWHPTNNIILATDGGDDFRMWNADNGDLLAAFDRARVPQFSPDGKMSCLIPIQNPENGEIIDVEDMTCLGISHGSNFALCRSPNNRNVHRVEIRTRKVGSPFSFRDIEFGYSVSSHLAAQIGHFQWKRNLNFFLGQYERRKLTILNLPDFSPRYTYEFEGESKCLCLSWVGASRFFATGSMDGKVRIWDGNSGECVRTFHGHSKKILSLSVSSNGDFLVSMCSRGMVCVFNISEFK